MFLLFVAMLILRSSLLIHCMLVISVYAECPEVRECMKCFGEADCILSSDNKRAECKAATASSCQPKTCGSPFYTCMASWSRSNPSGPWLLISDCVSAGTVDPCDTGEICEHQFDDALPDSVASGSFFCQCYGNFCNQNFLADASPPINNMSTIDPSPSSTATVSNTVMPTPTVEINERDCINCSQVEPNCTLSEDNRTLRCFIDDECANNIIRCDSRTGEVCGASWARRNSSLPWIANAGCLRGAEQPMCQGRGAVQPIPDTIEAGAFFCTCLGGLCNKEFGIDLNDFTTTTTLMSPTLSTDPVNPTATTMAPTISVGEGNTVSAAHVNTDGKFIFYAVKRMDLWPVFTAVFIVYGAVFFY